MDARYVVYRQDIWCPIWPGASSVVLCWEEVWSREGVKPKRHLAHRYSRHPVQEKLSQVVQMQASCKGKWNGRIDFQTRGCQQNALQVPKRIVVFFFFMTKLNS